MTSHSTSGYHHSRIKSCISSSHKYITSLDKTVYTGILIYILSVHIFNVDFIDNAFLEPIPSEAFDKSNISLNLIISWSSAKDRQQMIVTNTTGPEQTSHKATRDHLKCISTIEKESQTRFMQIDKFSILSKFNFDTMNSLINIKVVIVFESSTDQNIFCT